MAKCNVIKDYDWTSIPRGSPLRNKAPRAWVKSYKLKGNDVLRRLKGYLTVGTSSNADDFYKKLYGDSATPEDDFNFPFFSDNIRSFSNTFGDTFQDGFGGSGGIGQAGDSLIQSLLGTGAQVAGAIGQNALDSASTILKSNANISNKITGSAAALINGIKEGGDAGTYIETPKLYQYENNDAPLEISFVLSNTINDDYEKNYNLVKKLTTINRPLRLNSIAMEPPRIFQVKVPGHRFIQWASCSSFSVSFLGTKREIAGKIVPEAYLISMSYTSLTVEAANFMDKV